MSSTSRASPGVGTSLQPVGKSRSLGVSSPLCGNRPNLRLRSTSRLASFVVFAPRLPFAVARLFGHFAEKQRSLRENGRCRLFAQVAQRTATRQRRRRGLERKGPHQCPARVRIPRHPQSRRSSAPTGSAHYSSPERDHEELSAQHRRAASTPVRYALVRFARQSHAVPSRLLPEPVGPLSCKRHRST